ncbi:hypothetical protein EDB84DRAFT_1446587 [Lactarius hengduanensis]|nr:hypothetical protein EDB84DRAFT_1446587 [Lactarius hengduanensis]
MSPQILSATFRGPLMPPLCAASAKQSRTGSIRMNTHPQCGLSAFEVNDTVTVGTLFKMNRGRGSFQFWRQTTRNFLCFGNNPCGVDNRVEYECASFATKRLPIFQCYPARNLSGRAGVADARADVVNSDSGEGNDKVPVRQITLALCNLSSVAKEKSQRKKPFLGYADDAEQSADSIKRLP